MLFLLTSGINVITLALAGLGCCSACCRAPITPAEPVARRRSASLVFVWFLLLPPDRERLSSTAYHGRVAKWACATADTIRETARLLFSVDWRLLGAVGYLWFDIAVLWVCFKALGATPPIATIVLAYQIGYLSNLIPIPGGIGVLDGSLVGMFVLYGVNDTTATSATIVYHAISLWVPATWGTIAFVLLRRSRNQPVNWLPPRVQRRRA